MPNVVEFIGRCDGEPCKREDRLIKNEEEMVRLRGKMYHRGCEPTQAQLDAQNRGGD